MEKLKEFFKVITFQDPGQMGVGCLFPAMFWIAILFFVLGLLA